VLIKGIFWQLFAPRQTAEKPIVGAQVLKHTLIFSLKRLLRSSLILFQDLDGIAWLDDAAL
jgi:hypothetical protein